MTAIPDRNEKAARANGRLLNLKHTLNMNEASHDDIVDGQKVKYNRLTFLRNAPRDRQHRMRWVCLCDCGNETTTDAYAVKSGSAKSCGCLRHIGRPTRTTHGKSGTRIYSAWRSMRDRCLCPTHHAFKDYGERGITVCARWEKFENFAEDMGDIPSKDHTLERSNNSLGYQPGNCRWATRKEQQRNTRFNRILTVGGISKCVSAWAEEKGIHFNVIHDRLRLGWTHEDAVTIPHKPRNKRP